MLSYLWGGSKSTEKQVENADPKVALRQTLDDHAEIKVKSDGKLEFDDCCHIRAMTLRQA